MGIIKIEEDDNLFTSKVLYSILDQTDTSNIRGYFGIKNKINEDTNNTPYDIFNIIKKEEAGAELKKKIGLTKKEKKFSNNSIHNKSDLIQSALDYNNYLIQNIINKKNEMNNYEYESALNKLWDNLSVLAKHCDKYMEKFNLVDIPKNNNKNIQEAITERLYEDKKIENSEEKNATTRLKKEIKKIQIMSKDKENEDNEIRKTASLKNVINNIFSAKNIIDSIKKQTNSDETKINKIEKKINALKSKAISNN